MRRLLLLLLLGWAGLPLLAARAFVPLMAGQEARPLNGHFNAVPVLHSNQPEEVYGPGILINTAPGHVSIECGKKNVQRTMVVDTVEQLKRNYNKRELEAAECARRL